MCTMETRVQVLKQTLCQSVWEYVLCSMLYRMLDIGGKYTESVDNGKAMCMMIIIVEVI